MAKAIAMVELHSVARGIFVADQMVKVSDVDILTATTVCPGKYIVIVHGETSSVEASLKSGALAAEEYLVDEIFIPNVHEEIFPAIIAASMPNNINALGILESFSLSAMVIAADAVLKCAALEAIEIRLGTGLGGKSYFTFTGDVAAVKAGVEAGKKSLGERGMLDNAEVIPAPAKKLIETLY